MMILLALLAVFLTGCLIFIEAIRPYPSRESLFALKQRAKLSSDAKDELDRRGLMIELQTLYRLVELLIIVAIALVLAAQTGWIRVVICLAIIIVFYVPVSRLKFVQKLVLSYGAPIERFLCFVAYRFKRILKTLSSREQPEKEQRLTSIEELEYLLAHAEHVVSEDDRRIIKHGLASSSKTIKDIMTPRKAIKSIDRNEYLGPLVLSELHEYGFRQLPVIHEDLDTVIGVLSLTDRLTLVEKKSATAEKAMHQGVLKIAADTKLRQAATELMASQEWLAIVVDEDGKTVGLVTISDVLRALTGLSLEQQR